MRVRAVGRGIVNEKTVTQPDVEKIASSLGINCEQFLSQARVHLGDGISDCQYSFEPLVRRPNAMQVHISRPGLQKLTLVQVALHFIFFYFLFAICEDLERVTASTLISAIAAVLDYTWHEIRRRTEGLSFPSRRQQHNGTRTGVSERANGHDSHSEGTLRLSPTWIANKSDMSQMQLSHVLHGKWLHTQLIMMGCMREGSLCKPTGFLVLTFIRRALEHLLGQD